MRGKVQKWGNSLGIRIQKSVALQLNLAENSEVSIEVDDDCIRVTPLHGRKTLASMLEGITAENIHAEVDFGAPRGKEVW